MTRYKFQNGRLYRLNHCAILKSQILGTIDITGILTITGLYAMYM